MNRFWLLMVLLTAFGCSKHEIGSPPDYTTLSFPLSMMATPDEKRLYVVNTDFDMDYSSGWIATVDLETQEILPDAAIRVHPYGGDLVMSPDKKHAFLAQRWDSSIIDFDIDNKGLDCGQTTGRTCSDDHILYDKNEYDPVQKATLPRLGTDGYTTCIMNSHDPGPVLFVASVSDSYLAAYDISSGKPVFLAHIVLNPGVSTLACDPITHRVYVGHSTANQVDVVEVGLSAAKKFTMDRLFGFSSPETAAKADYFRHFSLSDQGDILYATYRSPDLLLAFDVSGDRPVFIGSVDLPKGPADFGFIHDPTYGDYAVVVCSDDGSIAIVSMDTREVMKRIKLCRDPYCMVLLPKSKKLVVSCFRSGSLGVLKWTDNPVTSMKVEGFLK